ncbi:hypothetical protein [Streptomyces sp. NBC_01340]|uniref:hypothetical protein n=1 Tax=Streptomyces sp. NBC_01340 TaxID=2903830 RepID=UPI002E0E3151
MSKSELSKDSAAAASPKSAGSLAPSSEPVTWCKTTLGSVQYTRTQGCLRGGYALYVKDDNGDVIGGGNVKTVPEIKLEPNSEQFTTWTEGDQHTAGRTDTYSWNKVAGGQATLGLNWNTIWSSPGTSTTANNQWRDTTFANRCDNQVGGNTGYVFPKAVILDSPVEPSVASSTYGFVRFIGGGMAPFVAGKFADATSLSVPFCLGGAAFILAVFVLASGHKLISAAETNEAHGETVRPTLERVGATPEPGFRPLIVAVGATKDAGLIVDTAADHARAAVLAHLNRPAVHGITATGQVLTSIGDHATAGRVLAQHAADVEAHTIAVGRSPRGPVAQFTDGSSTAALTHAAACNVVLVEPGRTPHRLTAESLEELRTKSL